MSAVAFVFAGQRFQARAAGTLWWPDRRTLIVADLHFGKSERMARRGGALLPPYEGLATLDRLEAEVAATDPGTVISLGDGLDDLMAAQALPDPICDRLAGLAVRRDWLWVAGNHDNAGVSPCARLAGRWVDGVTLDGVALRHQAVPGAGPDISGHFHPAVQLSGQRRRAFMIGAEHLILPAFGAYTGGMMWHEGPLRSLVPQGIAVACGPTALAMPIGHAHGKQRA